LLPLGGGHNENKKRGGWDPPTLKKQGPPTTKTWGKRQSLKVLLTAQKEKRKNIQKSTNQGGQGPPRKEETYTSKI